VVVDEDFSIDHLMSRTAFDATLAAIVAGQFHEFSIFFVDWIALFRHRRHLPQALLAQIVFINHLAAASTTLTIGFLPLP